jgi:superfamily II DNA/RNA helicase
MGRLKKRPRTETTRIDEEEEVRQLDKRVAAEAPAKGSQLQGAGKLKFESLPLSHRTMKGLEDAQFSVMTDIQVRDCPYVLEKQNMLC